MPIREQSPGRRSALTRRSFLKTTAAVAGASAVIGAGGALTALADGAAAPQVGEQVFSVACPINCGTQQCSMNAHVRDGKLYKVSTKRNVEKPEGLDYEFDRRPCLRGRSHVQWIYHPERIKYPMRRVEGTERGAGEWERITWDEALDEISKKFMQLKEEYGPHCIAMPSMTGSYGLVNGVTGMFWRFCNAIQASKLEYCLDWGTTHGEARVGGKVYYLKNSHFDIVNTKHAFLWGLNLTESCIQSTHFVLDAKERGAEIICIDPRYSITASKADVWVNLNPGTDGMLAFAMMNHIIEKGLYDVDYMLANTCAPYLVRKDTGKYLRMSDLGVAPEAGRINPKNGKAMVDDPVVVWDSAADAGASEYECDAPALEGEFAVNGIEVATSFTLLKERAQDLTPDEAADEVGLSADFICELAEKYADGPSGIYLAYGFDRFDNADIVGHTLATLASITGNLAVKGGGVGSLYTPHGSMLSAPVNFMFCDADHMAVDIPWISFPDIVMDGTYRGQEWPIKAMLNVNGNPLSNQTDQKEFLDHVLPKLEIVVTHDSWMTDTARYSDYVLPAAHYFEEDDLNYYGYLQLNEKAIEPLHEAKSNITFFTELAGKMGLGQFFTATAKDVIRTEVDGSAALAAMGITYDELCEKKTICNIAPSSYSGLPTNDFTFRTASTKLEFYQENPTPRMDYGQEVDKAAYTMPSVSRPIEVYRDNPLRETYPIYLYCEHSRWRVHSSYGHLPWLRELDPEPFVRLSPDDAAERGIADNDVVEVYNDHGSVKLKALVDPSLPKGMCNCQKGWQRDKFIEGGYQELTIRRYNHMNVNQSFNDVLCQIRKVD